MRRPRQMSTVLLGGKNGGFEEDSVAQEPASHERIPEHRTAGALRSSPAEPASASTPAWS